MKIPDNKDQLINDLWELWEKLYEYSEIHAGRNFPKVYERLKKEVERQEFMANYMAKHMKDHGLPYGFAYFELEQQTEKKAERAWKAYQKRNATVDKTQISKPKH